MNVYLKAHAMSSLYYRHCSLNCFLVRFLQAAVGQAFSQRAYGLFRGATEHDEVGVNGRLKKEKTAVERVLFDPEAVTRGDSGALCYLFSRIVLNTLYPRTPN